DLEPDQVAGLGLAFLDAVEDLIHLRIPHRHRLALRSEEARHPVDRGDQVIAAVGHVHVNEHVARHEAPLGRDLLAAADLDDLLGRHENLVDLVLQALFGDGMPDLLGNLLLEVRENAHRIPPLRHLPQTSLARPQSAGKSCNSSGFPHTLPNKNSAHTESLRAGAGKVRLSYKPSRAISRPNGPQPPIPRIAVSPVRMRSSMRKKEIGVSAAMMKTMNEVVITSLRVGEWTLAVSTPTCSK